MECQRASLVSNIPAGEVDEWHIFGWLLRRFFWLCCLSSHRQRQRNRCQGWRGSECCAPPRVHRRRLQTLYRTSFASSVGSRVPPSSSSVRKRVVASIGCRRSPPILCDRNPISSSPSLLRLLVSLITRPPRYQ